jgi:transposase-like protein
VIWQKKEIEKILAGIDFKNLATEVIKGPNVLLKIFTKRELENAMNAEMTNNPGYEKHQAPIVKTSNNRNAAAARQLKLRQGMSPETASHNMNHR